MTDHTQDTLCAAKFNGHVCGKHENNVVHRVSAVCPSGTYCGTDACHAFVAPESTVATEAESFSERLARAYAYADRNTQQVFKCALCGRSEPTRQYMRGHFLDEHNAMEAIRA